MSVGLPDAYNCTGAQCGGGLNISNRGGKAVDYQWWFMFVLLGVMMSEAHHTEAEEKKKYHPVSYERTEHGRAQPAPITVTITYDTHPSGGHRPSGLR